MFDVDSTIKIYVKVPREKVGGFLGIGGSQEYKGQYSPDKATDAELEKIATDRAQYDADVDAAAATGDKTAGDTFDKSIIIVDEYQNLNYNELDSIMTRVGQDSKIMFCGDATQTDLTRENEKNGIVDFMRILRLMSSMEIIEFGVEDIVRSGLVKEYILAKLELGL